MRLYCRILKKIEEESDKKCFELCDIFLFSLSLNQEQKKCFNMSIANNFLLQNESLAEWLQNVAFFLHYQTKCILTFFIQKKDS